MKTCKCKDLILSPDSRPRSILDGLVRVVVPLKGNITERHGFTLLELLIVIVIIGLLASVVAPKLIGRIGKSKTVVARAQVESFGTALETYRLDTGEYPTQEQKLTVLIARPDGVQGWYGPYLRKKVIPNDPWGQPYIYRYPGENGDYDIISYGADKREGGTEEDKDIVSWE